MIPALAAAQHPVFKDTRRALAGILLGEAQVNATNDQEASAHLLCFNDRSAMFLSDLLARTGITTERHADCDSFARSNGLHQASCLIVDASVFDLAGQVKTLRTLSTQLPTIMIVGPRNLRAAVQALRMGTIDLLERPLDHYEVSRVISSAIGAGRAWRLWNFCCLELQSRFSLLTLRERQVLELVTQGRLNKQIAWTLGLSEITVKCHRGSLVRKMRARSVADLVRMADALVEVLDESTMSHSRTSR